MGRFEREKNIELLIKSFAELKNNLSNGVLVLVGEGREKNQLEKQIENLGLKDVHFISTIEYSLVPEIINCADVLVITSEFESGPLVALESIACGVPVVMTDVGRARELITNDFVGRIVNWDEKSISFGVMDILSMDKNKVIKACQEAAVNFDCEITIEKTIEIYRKAIFN